MSEDPAIPAADFAQEAPDGQPEGESTPGAIPPDWEAIQEAFRAGAQSLREIAGKHGVTEGAIRARAKKAGWTRATGVTQCVEPRVAALEEQVAALSGLVEEMGVLLEELTMANAGALRQQRKAQPWQQTQRPPSRWG
ncbi:MAG: hypothetical protein P4L36_11560 [Holophaga sp.]|nr:hypothetical protein [Holophaga sp.]